MTHSLENKDTPNPHKKQGVRRLMLSVVNSMQGIASALKHESAFRQECILAVIFVVAIIWLPVPLTAKAILTSSLLIVLITELLNSAVEWVVDYISLEEHPYAKRAKDMGSAAVFFSLLNVAITWFFVIADNWTEIL